MARYWIGGTGNWEDTAHWSTASGGSGGADVPTSVDDVFIDTNSGFGGGGTIDTSNFSIDIHEFTSTTGSAYTIEGATSNFHGSVQFESGITYGLPINFIADGEDITIDMAGVKPFNCSFDTANGGSITLLSDFICDALGGNSSIVLGANDTGLNFDANGFDVGTQDDTGIEVLGSGGGSTLIMGAGTWETSSFTVDEIQFGSTVTIVPETSTIKLIGDDSSFVGGGKTFNNLWFAGVTGTYAVIEGSNTFNDLKINPNIFVKPDSGSTTTLTTFTAIGTPGNLITLDSFDGVTQFTFSKASGVVSCDYLNISNSNATGGALWYAGDNSLDTTNNDGWLFRAYTTTTTTSTSSSTSTSTSTSSTTTHPEEIGLIYGFTKPELMYGDVVVEE